MFNEAIANILEQVISICVSVGIVAAAIHWLAKGSGWVVNKATKKSTQLSDEMKDMHKKCDTHCEHVDACLDRDNKRLRRLEDCMPILLKGFMNLISHEIDGNHTTQLKESEKEIRDYLIKR